MKTISRNKRQLIINGVLAVFTLLVLIVSVVAWFSNSTTAYVENINLKVERTEIVVDKMKENILFPCATKINDVDADQFDAYCAVVRTYTVKGEGSIFVDVDCNDTGMVAYVLPDHDGAELITADYYQTIINQLTSEQTGTYEQLIKAMTKVNERNGRVGITITDDNGDKNTQVRVLYWLEYDKVADLLQSDSYQELAFEATLTFTV